MPRGCTEPESLNTINAQKSSNCRHTLSAWRGRPTGLKIDQNEGNTKSRERAHGEKAPTRVLPAITVTCGLHGASSPRRESEAARASGPRVEWPLASAGTMPDLNRRGVSPGRLDDSARSGPAGLRGTDSYPSQYPAPAGPPVCAIRGGRLLRTPPAGAD